MNKEAWKKYPNFNEYDNWGNTGILSEDLVIKLYTIQSIAKTKLIVHCTTRGIHKPNSYHYVGLACDFHLEGLSLLEQYLIAEKIIGQGGIGLYPEWKPQAGLHVDLRCVYVGARWIFYDEEYLELCANNFYLIL